MPLIGTKVRDNSNEAMTGGYPQLGSYVPFRRARCMACQVDTDREGVQPIRRQAVPLHELSVDGVSSGYDHLVEHAPIQDARRKVAVERRRYMPTLDDLDSLVHQPCCHGAQPAIP